MRGEQSQRLGWGGDAEAVSSSGEGRRGDDVGGGTHRQEGFGGRPEVGQEGWGVTGPRAVTLHLPVLQFAMSSLCYREAIFMFCFQKQYDS